MSSMGCAREETIQYQAILHWPTASMSMLSMAGCMGSSLLCGQSNQLRHSCFSSQSNDHSTGTAAARKTNAATSLLFTVQELYKEVQPVRNGSERSICFQYVISVVEYIILVIPSKSLATIVLPLVAAKAAN